MKRVLRPERRIQDKGFYYEQLSSFVDHVEKECCYLAENIIHSSRTFNLL